MENGKEIDASPEAEGREGGMPKVAKSALQLEIEAQEDKNQAEFERRMEIYLGKQEKVSKKAK